MNQPTTKKSSNVTQAVITPDQYFILAKKFNEVSDVICPFIKTDENEFYTNFTISINQLHRIQTLYEMITTGIARFTVYEDMIIFDCCKKLPASVFGNVEQGYIHYISTTEKNEETKVNNIVVEPKLVISTDEEYEEIPIEYDQKIKFKSSHLKVFPSILKNGFLFSSVDQQICTLFATVLNPSQNFVGECSKYEVNNIIQYILPLWSIFDINISKSIQVYIRDNFLPEQLKKYDIPIMFMASYNLAKPNEIKVKMLGTGVNVDV